MKRLFKIIVLILASVIIFFLIYVCVTFPPVMTGMVAKTMCSCVYVTGRTPESVVEKELQVFPGLSSATIRFDDTDSTVTAKILWKTTKAIFRKGLGCTLLASLTEDEIRKQRIILSSTPLQDQELVAWPMGNNSKDSLYRFPYEKLFYKTGMNHTLIEPDPSGTFVGSSYSYGSVRDWARFGLLYLNDGVWAGERILPEGWVKYTTVPAPATQMGEYGAHWWLNKGSKENVNLRKYPELPTDAYWADGFEEQYVMVYPLKNLSLFAWGFRIMDLISQDWQAEL